MVTSAGTLCSSAAAGSLDGLIESSQCKRPPMPDPELCEARFVPNSIIGPFVSMLKQKQCYMIQVHVQEKIDISNIHLNAIAP